MNLALAVEIALSVLLAATLVYCAILERRLAALRKGQDGFRETIGEMNSAITTAGASMRLLKSAATGIEETLEERLARARNAIDELSVLVASGERIAQRFERATPSERNPGTPAVLANRLDRLKGQSFGAEAARSMAQVR